MFGLSFSPKKATLQIVIDSRKISASITIYDTKKNIQEVVWNHVESGSSHLLSTYAALQNEIKTLLLQTGSIIASKGLQALHTRADGYHITHVEIIIAAPWVYTFIQKAGFSKDHSFHVTSSLLTELQQKAQEKISKTASHNEILKTLELKTIRQVPIATYINGYLTQKLYGTHGSAVDMTYLQSVVPTEIFETIEDMLTKVVSDDIHRNYSSAMYDLYTTLKNTYPQVSEACIVNITEETLERGVVRNGILDTVSYSTFGMYPLLRSIASKCKIPHEESYSYIKANDMENTIHLSKEAQKKYTEVIEQFEKEISKIFLKRDDGLPIPKSIFIHGHGELEDFYIETIKRATAQDGTKKNSVYVIKNNQLSSNYELQKK